MSAPHLSAMLAEDRRRHVAAGVAALRTPGAAVPPVRRRPLAALAGLVPRSLRAARGVAR